MFERYTEKARRVIFFARYEASQFGSPYIETEHLLLGLLREDKALTNRFLRSHASVESIRKQVEAHSPIGEKIATSVDLPLSNECKRVLAYAAEEAERLGHKHIGTEHLLLGLMREEKCFAADLLKERGLKLEVIREEVSRITEEKGPAQSRAEDAPLTESLRDLTQAATDGILEPVVGREQELDAVIEILCSRNRRNPLLIGERGVGKAAIVDGLAQRIADGAVPACLAEKRILVFDPGRIGGGIKNTHALDEVLGTYAKSMLDRQKSEERMNNIVKTLANAPNVIWFVDELLATLTANNPPRQSSLARILKPALMQGEIQLIGACVSSEHTVLTQAAPWLQDCFQTVHVRPMDEPDTLRVLQIRKAQFEKFHEVTYSEEALECAAQCNSSYLPDSSLPGKALDLIDAAGARLKLRQTALPEEVIEVQKRIRFIVHQMDSAIASHEFEKARFYSDEERKERENLRVIQERYKLDESAFGVVSREDVEEVVSRWAKYPFQL